MKLYYIVNSRIPTEKARGIQVMKMCESFAKLGVEVELVVPGRFNKIKDDPFIYYNILENFKIKRVLTFDLVKFGRVGFLIQNFTFALSVFFYSFRRNDAIFYVRDEFSAFFLNLISKKVFWEAHEGRFNFVIKFILKETAGIVTISDNLKKFFIKVGGNEKKIIVAPDGVDLRQFLISQKKEDCRTKLGLPQNKKIILYTGHLYSWKGADVLAKSAGLLSDEYLILFVGGSEKDVERYREEYLKSNNIKFTGWKSYDLMPYYMKAADLLILPNSGKEDISRLYTSPMKLFEYMASGNPIIASDLPSIREVLDENNAYLVKSDNPDELAKAIMFLMENKEVGNRLSKQASADVKNYSWENRVNLILKFIDV